MHNRNLHPNSASSTHTFINTSVSSPDSEKAGKDPQGYIPEPQIASDDANDQDQDDKVRSTLMSKNVTILGRRTSVRLEPEMWLALKDISRRERCSIHDICSLIHVRKNPLTSLTAAIRVFLMLYYRAASTEEGHQRAGHGNFENMKRRAKVTTDPKTPVQQTATSMPCMSANKGYLRIIQST